MLRLASTLSFALLSGCYGDETLSAYGASGVTWQLAELDGAPFASIATLTFPEEGKVAGSGPCNVFSGQQTAPYPWIELTNLAVTRRACPDLAAEGDFFKALSEMTLAEVSGDVLVLSNDTGREMVFNATQP